MSTPIQQADTRKTTNLLKKLLKQKFGIDASVRSESYSGGSSLRISYSLGPDESIVEAVVKNLQYGYFDGMTDEYKGVKVDPIIVDGYQLNTYKFVFVKQEITRDFKSRVATLIRKHVDTSRRGRTEDEDFMYDVKPRHFVTDNEAEIELVSVDFSRVDYTLIYKLIGSDTLYSTATEPKKLLKFKPGQHNIVKGVEVGVVKALTIENNEPIQLVEYSEKSFALIGLGTKAIKDELTKYGSFNRHLKCGAGWIFSNKHLATIKTLIGQ